MVPLIPRWYSDDGTLTARNTVSSVAAEEYRPVEPGGYFVGQNLQQAQLRVEDWERIRNRILRLGQDEAEEALEEQREGPDPGGRNQAYKLEGEAAPRTTEVLRKGADAVRGRDRSHQGTNGRN
jgi:hypothetical protein